METQWSQLKLQQYINDGVEERHNLEYKGAAALQRTDKYKKEITKDVSAMANAAGGVLVYGISEYDEAEKKHLPKDLDPVNRVDYSKEWLEQVISNIRPRIEGIIIHSIALDTGENNVAYVVEIPKSNTAHQARDLKYYLRYNFESVPMEDSQIRDVMDRGTKPDASIQFIYKLLRPASSQKHKYLLRLFIKNHGTQVIAHYQLVFTIPEQIPMQYNNQAVRLTENVVVRARSKGGFRISCRSSGVLFPDEELEIGVDIGLKYDIDNKIYHDIKQHEPTLDWRLYADDMIPKYGKIPFSNLHNF